MTEPKYPFAKDFNKGVGSTPRKPAKPKPVKVDPIPPNPSTLPFETRGRKRRTKEIDLTMKTYLQVVGAPVLAIEDFYPGCVCAVGQILPEEVDTEFIVSMIRVGMRNDKIAHLVDLTETTLMTHFGKTIAKERAARAAELLGTVSDKADDGDMGAINMLLTRVDPPPKEGPQTLFIAPVPQHLMDMPAAELTAQLKQLKNNKGD